MPQPSFSMFNPAQKTKPVCKGKPGEQGFSFAEILAAMLFTAIVIPVALHGIGIANRAAVIAERKVEAVQIADRLLEEMILTDGWLDGTQEGTIDDQITGYQWKLVREAWQEEGMYQVTMIVSFNVQDRDYSVELSTLVEETES